MAPQILRVGPAPRRAPMAEFGRLEHLAHIERPANRILSPVASVDYHDARMARGSQPAGGQPRFSRFVRRGASFHCCWGVRARVSARACVQSSEFSRAGPGM